MTGRYFSDNDSSVDSKVIHKVQVRVRDVVEGISLEFTDGSATPWRGGKTGTLQEFVLHDGEDITRVSICSDGTVIQKLSFHTSFGQQSNSFGTDGERIELWEFNQHALAGFSGSTGKYLTGLQALWSQHKTLGIYQLADEAKAMAINIPKDTQKNDGLVADVQALSTEITEGFHVPADEALAGIITLSHSVEELSKAKASGSAHDALVAKCKGQSKTVSRRFAALGTKAEKLLVRATELALEITHQATAAQTKTKRVSEMLQISHIMQEGQARLREIRVTRVADAQHRIQVAKEARQLAEENKDEAKTDRIIRDIFTFGLGEIGDWGGLAKAIDYADALIASADADLESAQAGLADAQSKLDAIDQEIARFTDLKGQLDGFGPVLKSQAGEMAIMSKRILEVENNSLDVSVFLGSVVAKADVLWVQHTASKLADSVLKIEQEMKTGRKLTGALFEDPDGMDAILKVIAESPVESTAADEVM
ncbi:hypothetical protein C8R47DRAFT_999151 [Mycena vitilis]|nr:hypothetical protein C8R47DRAFT_999151 [Mycena vitilis]